MLQSKDFLPRQRVECCGTDHRHYGIPPEYCPCFVWVVTAVTSAAIALLGPGAFQRQSYDAPRARLPRPARFGFTSTEHSEDPGSTGVWRANSRTFGIAGDCITKVLNARWKKTDPGDCQVLIIEQTRRIALFRWGRPEGFVAERRMLAISALPLLLRRLQSSILYMGALESSQPTAICLRTDHPYLPSGLL